MSRRNWLPRRARSAAELASLIGAAVLATSLVIGCGDPRKDPKPTATGSSSSGTSVVTSSRFGPNATAGIAMSAMNERQKSDLFTTIDDTLAPCPDTPVPLGQCIAENRGCKGCAPAADFLARLIKLGAQKADRMKFYEARFDPKAVVKIPASDAPTRGPADAPVQIVEWADFTCPACNAFRFYIELMEERFPGQVRVTYRTYNLAGHDKSPIGSAAARAAQNQGKFWEMHKLIFDNQDKLEKKLVLEFAKQLDLDMEKFKADFDSEETKKYVEGEMKAAEDLGLDGTPFLFINGRRAPLELLAVADEFERWLKLEIELAGKTPAEPTKKYFELYKEMHPEDPNAPGGGHAPGPGGSASPSASAAPSAEAPASASATSSAGPSDSASPAASAAPSASPK